MKKFIVCLCFSIFVILNIAFAYELPEKVRVGLSYGSNAVSEFTMSAPSGIKVDGIGKMTGKVTFSKSGSNKLTISNSSKTKTCSVSDEDGIKVELVDLFRLKYFLPFVRWINISN